MRRPWTALLTGFLLTGILHADPKLEQFFAQNCVKCHGPEKQKGKVRLDKPVGALFADEELLETIATVLEAGEMPPEEAPQPTAAVPFRGLANHRETHPRTTPGQSIEATHAGRIHPYAA